VRDENGAKTTEEQLWMAEFVVLFTTVLAAKLTAEQLVELYRLRWQVELEFKRAKSLMGLDKLPNYLPETILSWIAAKLWLQQVLRVIAARSSVDAFSALRRIPGRVISRG
jgi:IS4 transposase